MIFLELIVHQLHMALTLTSFIVISKRKNLLQKKSCSGHGDQEYYNNKNSLFRNSRQDTLAFLICTLTMTKMRPPPKAIRFSR